MICACYLHKSDVENQISQLHDFAPLSDPSVVFIRGPGDGMETAKPAPSLEMSVETLPLKISLPRQCPRTALVSPGVLHLGKVSRDSCTEVEAVRIIVPRAAIIRSVRAGAHADSKTDERGSGSPHHGEDRPPSPSSEPQDYKSVVEKLQNSERRLLQDKEGLSNQLRVQTEVRPRHPPPPRCFYSETYFNHFRSTHLESGFIIVLF